jgi:F-type H+-transporting ATPase subunit b
MLLNFILLIGALVYLLRKPVAAALHLRHDKVRTEAEESERLRLEAEKMVRDYGQKLAGLDAEIAELLATARAEGESERKKILERARLTAERILEDARQAAAREAERVKERLQKEVVEEAVRLASERLVGRVTEKEHRLFTETLMKRLEGGNGSN